MQNSEFLKSVVKILAIRSDSARRSGVEAEISAQKPTVIARFHGQAVLQGRVLDGMSAEIDRALREYRNWNSEFRA
jgi:hypothetical protein